MKNKEILNDKMMKTKENNETKETSINLHAIFDC